MFVSLDQSNIDGSSYTHASHQVRDGIERMKSLLAIMEHFYTPIHHIPEEVLTTIFSLALDRAPHRLRSGYNADFDPEHVLVAHNSPLLVISHTCKRWRDIALRFPTFWTVFDGRNIERLRTCLSRSQSLPMDLFISTCQAQELLSILQNDIHRVNDLHLLVHDDSRHDSLSAETPSNTLHFTAILPLLKATNARTLKVTFQDPKTALDYAVSSVILFGNPECFLQALAIEVAFWVPANSFPTLTHLRLLCVDQQTSKTCPHILKLLANSPALRHLSLFGFVCSDAFLPYTRPSTPTTLHHLRSAHFVQCAWSTVQLLLQDLRFPSEALVHVTGLLEWDDWPPAPIPILEDLTSMELVVFKLELSQLIVNRPARGILIQGDLLSQEYDYNEWAAQLFTALSHATITSLRLGAPWRDWCHYKTDNEAILSAVLSPLVDLEELRLSLGDPNWISIFIDAIAGALCEQPVRCPWLAVLEIEISPDIINSSDSVLDSPTWDLTSKYLAPFTTMLAERARMGHKLGRVVVACAFPSSSGFASTFESWRELVMDLEVRWGDASTPVWEFAVPDAGDCLEGIDAYWDCQDLQPDCYKLQCQRSAACPMRAMRYASAFVLLSGVIRWADTT